jgi:hypothetical protein
MNLRQRMCSILWLLPALAGVALDAHDARACGGCFHPVPPPNPRPNEVETVVTEHRMALAMSTTQSVLWDQIRYSGNPKEFAWVLPVQPGTQVQLSTDAWLAALDVSTETIIRPPPLPYCAPPSGSYSGGGNNGGGDTSTYGGGSNGVCSPGSGATFDQPSSGSGGCGCIFGGAGAGSFFSGSAGPPAQCPSIDTSGSPGSGSGGAEIYGGVAGEIMGDGSAVPPLPPPVTVQTRETVGPYDVVILRSSMGEALDAWLLANGFEIPPNIQPILDAYVTEKLDFVAMKLRPGVNVNAMRPVRVVEPGADPNLPLRMISAGAGAHVGLTLWVISEGRYQPQNFPNATIDFSQLVYNVAQKRSNYTNLRAAALSGGLTDAGTDPGTDAEPAATDAGRDASTDVETDAGTDAETDAGTDAETDAGTDAETDAGTDAEADAATDAQTDAGTDAGTAARTGYWLTEFAGPAQLKRSAANGLTPGLLDAYAQACVPRTPMNPCDGGANRDGGEDGGLEGGEAGLASDGVSDANATEDATQEAGAGSLGDDGAASMASAGCTPPAPTVCDDPEVAFTGLHMGSIWITRLVADVPSSALGQDLVLEATPDQSAVANVHQAQSWVDGNPCSLSGIGTLSTRSGPGAPPAGATATTGGQSCTLASKRSGDGTGACAILGVTALTLARWKRRRRRCHREELSPDESQ